MIKILLCECGGEKKNYFFSHVLCGGFYFFWMIARSFYGIFATSGHEFVKLTVKGMGRKEKYYWDLRLSGKRYIYTI